MLPSTCINSAQCAISYELSTFCQAQTLLFGSCSAARGSGASAQPQAGSDDDPEAPLMRHQHMQDHLADLPLPNQVGPTSICAFTILAAVLLGPAK